MPHYENASAKGEVTDVFAHRFIIRSQDKKILADFGKHNQIQLQAGDMVEVTGEQKPSELKVNQMTINGEPVALTEKPAKDHHGKKHQLPDADPEIAIEAAKKQHLEVLGRPRQKPKHFEIIGKDASGKFFELHVEFDGAVRHKKAVDPMD